MGLDMNRPFVPVRISVLTLSDTRTEENDHSGGYLIQAAQAAGHIIYDRKIICDDKERIINTLKEYIDNPIVDVVLCTGGTGLTQRDQTPEALKSVAENNNSPNEIASGLFRYMFVASGSIGSDGCMSIKLR